MHARICRYREKEKEKEKERGIEGDIGRGEGITCRCVIHLLTAGTH